MYTKDIDDAISTLHDSILQKCTPEEQSKIYLAISALMTIKDGNISSKTTSKCLTKVRYISTIQPPHVDFNIISLYNYIQKNGLITKIINKFTIKTHKLKETYEHYLFNNALIECKYIYNKNDIKLSEIKLIMKGV